MLNLDELTLYYINTTFQSELKPVVYASFSIMEMFGIKFYEDSYIDIIRREDTASSDDKKDIFMHLLKRDINNIILEHGIVISDEMEVMLTEYNEIAQFLYLIQNLEDYTEVGYRLHAADKARLILIDLIVQLSFLSKPRLLDIIVSVKDGLISSLKDYIADRIEDTSDEPPYDVKRKDYIDSFFSFIDEEDCLGLELYRDGYTNVTLHELNDLLTFSLSDHIDRTIVTNPAKAALEVLSLLVITKDTYSLPILKFSKNTGIFTSKMDNVAKINSIMLRMLNDFESRLYAEKQQGILNGQA